MKDTSLVTPVFLISLPRSGSTLLQRLLATHEAIATCAEPWIMLPLAYISRTNGIWTQYGHHQSVKALHCFENHLDMGQTIHVEAIRAYGMTMYRAAARGCPWFLDKTPRYYHIIPFLAEVFPDARFVFLFRDPLSIIASMIDVVRGNSIRRVDHLAHDVDVAPRLMVRGIQHVGNRGIILRYEDLVQTPEVHLERLFEFLGLPPEKEALRKFVDVSFQGLGDPLTESKKRNISGKLDKWRDIVDSPLRRLYVRRKLRFWNDRYLEIGGYPREALFRNLASARISRLRPEELLYLAESSLASGAKWMVYSFFAKERAL